MKDASQLTKASQVTWPNQEFRLKEGQEVALKFTQKVKKQIKLEILILPIVPLYKISSKNVILTQNQ